MLSKFVLKYLYTFITSSFSDQAVKLHSFDWICFLQLFFIRSIEKGSGQNVRWLPWHRKLFVTPIYNVWKTSLKEVVRVRVGGHVAVLGLASVTAIVIANLHEKCSSVVGRPDPHVWVMPLQRSQDDDKDKWSQRQTNLYSIAYLRKEVER